MQISYRRGKGDSDSSGNSDDNSGITNIGISFFFLWRVLDIGTLVTFGNLNQLRRL